MPRPLVFGNGELLVCQDGTGTIRDLHWPLYAHLNHLNGHPVRLGVWTVNGFAWLHDDGWTRRQAYDDGALIGDSEYRHNGLWLSLTVREAVDPERPWFAREVTVQNLGAEEREVRLFQSHDLRLNESDVGDCAFYHPDDALVHFKDHVAFAFAGGSATGGLFGFATGIKAFDGLEGTWRDAEDGVLEGDPIAQGSVDSTLGVSLTVPAGGVATAWLAMVAGDSVDAAMAGLAELRRLGTSSVLDRRRSHDAGLHPALPEDEFTADVRRSLLLIETNVSREGGVVAANDSDIMETNRATYSYIWPRDGALTCEVLAEHGRGDLRRNFVRWAMRVFDPKRGVFFQKYRGGHAWGASWHPWVGEFGSEFPHQQDETALTVIAACREAEGDPEFAREVWPMVHAACQVASSLRTLSGLPNPSYDLWEERRGIHFWTVAAVAQALQEAAGLANTLGESPGDDWRRIGCEMTQALRTQFRLPGGGWARMLRPMGDGYEVDATPDAAVLGGSLILEAFRDGSELASALEWVTGHLEIRGGIGGVARYTGDYYFRRVDDHPGNPWIICTMWVAQAEAILARSPADLAGVRERLQWVQKRMATTGVLAEQYHPVTGEALSVSPLTWSHAEFVAGVAAWRAAKTKIGEAR